MWAVPSERARLLLGNPAYDCLLPVAHVVPELDVGDKAASRVLAHPAHRDAEQLGDVGGGEQMITRYLSTFGRLWRCAAGSGLVEQTIDERSDAGGAAGRRCAKAAGCRQAPSKRLADSEFDLLRLGAGFKGVDDRAFGACHGDAGEAADLVRARGMLERVEPNAGARALAAVSPWQRDVDGVRDHVGELVQLERTLMRDDRRARQGKPGSDDVLMLARGEVTQPVEAPRTRS